mmetsp:Transcript_3681/g.8531  ORF Transcript_3681/g.8531 Transcript_3681/m.8531 type:complete len:200 (-) Transcript_3681:145-744(-)
MVSMDESESESDEAPSGRCCPRTSCIRPMAAEVVATASPLASPPSSTSFSSPSSSSPSLLPITNMESMFRISAILAVRWFFSGGGVVCGSDPRVSSPSLGSAGAAAESACKARSSDAAAVVVGWTIPSCFDLRPGTNSARFSRSSSSFASAPAPAPPAWGDAFPPPLSAAAAAAWPAVVLGALVPRRLLRSTASIAASA